MKSIKIMLLGIAFMILPIAVHLFLEAGLFTDLIVIIGLIIVIMGYHWKDEN